MDENFEDLIKNSFFKAKLKTVLNPILYPVQLRILLLLSLTGTAFYLYSFNKKGGNFYASPGTTESVLSFPKNSQLPEIQNMITLIDNRKLFKAPKKPPPPAPKPVKTGPGIQEKMKSLVLLGVVEDEPLQAIIECRKTRETYYVKPGDSFFDMEIEAITKGQVTLRYEEETGVLR